MCIASTSKNTLAVYPLCISMNGGEKFFFNILVLWAINIAQARTNARVARNERKLKKSKNSQEFSRPNQSVTDKARRLALQF